MAPSLPRLGTSPHALLGCVHGMSQKGLGAINRWASGDPLRKADSAYSGRLGEGPECAPKPPFRAQTQLKCRGAKVSPGTPNGVASAHGGSSATANARGVRASRHFRESLLRQPFAQADLIRAPQLLDNRLTKVQDLEMGKPLHACFISYRHPARSGSLEEKLIRNIVTAIKDHIDLYTRAHQVFSTRTDWSPAISMIRDSPKPYAEARA